MKVLVKIMNVNNGAFEASCLNKLRCEGVNIGDIIEGEFNPVNKAVDFKSPKTGVNCCAFVDNTCKKVSDLEFEELCVETQDIVLGIGNTRQLWDKVRAIVECLVRKSKKQELSFEKLVTSSVIEHLCSQGVKDCKERGNKNIKTIHRKEFKHYYTQYILDEVESEICNQ